ncbi:hypothetical protein MMC18_009288 [Xylographa bjoerkii]|nr:hypothetical protein [Xylographa bjoerkii]
MSASTYDLSSHLIAPEALQGIVASVSANTLSDEVLSCQVTVLHSGNSQPIPLAPRENLGDDERSGSYLAPASPLLPPRPASPKHSKIEHQSYSCTGTPPHRLSIVQMLCTYTCKERCWADSEVCSGTTPCQKYIIDRTLFRSSRSVKDPATPGLSTLEVDLLLSSDETGKVDALRDIPKRKPSAAELYPRTNHEDKEEWWDESGFLGQEADERLLKEMGQESLNVGFGSQEQYSKVCSDPCWR